MKNCKFPLFQSPFLLVFIFLLSGFALKGKNDTRIILSDSKLPRAAREAILVLPGLGDSHRGRNAQVKFFANRGYDVYIPDFLDRKSYQKSVENLAAFYHSSGLTEYKKVHAFCYILGSYAINDFLAGLETHNIETIIYDRSPLQERAPYVVATAIPGIGKLVVGNVVIDFNTVSYSPMPDTTIRVGLIVESKATRLIRIFKKTALKPGPVSWAPDSLHQAYDDIHYTRLNHDQMYHRFDVVGEEILYFLNNGEFSPNSVDMAYSWNPFKPWKKRDEKSVSGNSRFPQNQPEGVFIQKWFEYQ
ncbi:MAG: hypothetical protein R3C61_04835 [Bacteroidia bacterium]